MSDFPATNSPSDAQGSGAPAPVGLDPRSLEELVGPLTDELVSVRRDLHRHPELGRGERRSTALVQQRLARAGVASSVLPCGTGLVADIGPEGGNEPLLALRADLDALPVRDQKTVPYRSTVEGVSHACGHDVHTAVVLGTGLVLAELARSGRLRHAVRLIFQPAEELMPGGALDVIESGALEGIERILAVHCDPRLPTGQVGVRPGPVTAAADHVTVHLAGPGGHTARPHLTADLIHALGAIITQLPTLLSRKVDPRAGLSVVWGRVTAGSTANAIPEEGVLAGTLRCLDRAAWEAAPDLVRGLVYALAVPYGVRVEVDYVRGVPPVDNDMASADLLARAGRAALGAEAVVPTEQSLGGEDFAWYLREVPGALARLGVASPAEVAAGVVRDLHQGGFDVDERAIPVGTRFLLAACLLPAQAPLLTVP